MTAETKRTVRRHLHACVCYDALVAAVGDALTLIADDHSCLDCGMDAPNGRGGQAHPRECITHTLGAALNLVKDARA